METYLLGAEQPEDAGGEAVSEASVALQQLRPARTSGVCLPALAVAIYSRNSSGGMDIWLLL
jgi:hypothetical protein